MGKTPLRPYGGVVRTSMRAPQLPEEEVLPLVVSKISGGLDTSSDPADIDQGSLQVAINSRVRYDKTLRRAGTEAFGATKPNSASILALYAFIASDGTSTILRLTPASIYRNPTSWTALTGTLTGTASNRFSIVSAFDQVVVANGVDDIKVLDLTANTFADLGNAPKYKFITAFANRIVGFNLRTSGSEDPIGVGWSGNGAITQWDPLVDISAGSASIIESPGDLADFITGGFGFTNVMVVPRQRSIWIATKTGIPTQPFAFSAVVPGIGFGCPYSIAVIPGGLVGADHRTQKVYVYVPGEQPLSISTKIEKDLFANISDPEAVFGSYDNKNNEYSLAIPQVGSTLVKVWIYNFRTQAWTYDERTNLTCIADIEGAAQELMIDDLSGMIDDLIGDIDDLVIPTTAATSRIYGFSDGDLELERQAETADVGVSFETTLVSKQFNLPVTDLYVSRIRYEVFCRRQTTFNLYYSKDSGLTWTLARTDVVTTVNTPVVINFNRSIKCRKFTFKITSSDGDWDIIDYELHVVRSGTSQATSIGSL